MPLDAPPRDDCGNVVPHDHSGINADDGVIRRIARNQLVYDAKLLANRPSTMAFQPSTGEGGGMSVDLERLIEEAGVDPVEYVCSRPWVGAVRFTAGALRAEGLMVGFDPLPSNPYHGEVWGNFSKGLQKRLLCLYQVLVPWEKDIA